MSPKQKSLPGSPESVHVPVLKPDDDNSVSTKPDRGLWRRFSLVPLLIASIWFVFAVSWLVPLNGYGLVPRTIDGLVGIVGMPFLHANLAHLTANTVPLIVLLTLMVISRPHPWRAVAGLVLVSGVSIWVLARPVTHIGASGLVYALMGYLMVVGLRERRIVSLLVAVAVGIGYGSVILAGIIPGVPGVSWESHLFGLISGGILAIYANPAARPQLI